MVLRDAEVAGRAKDACGNHHRGVGADAGTLAAPDRADGLRAVVLRQDEVAGRERFHRTGTPGRGDHGAFGEADDGEVGRDRREVLRQAIEQAGFAGGAGCGGVEQAAPWRREVVKRSRTAEVAARPASGDGLPFRLVNEAVAVRVDDDEREGPAARRGLCRAEPDADERGVRQGGPRPVVHRCPVPEVLRHAGRIGRRVFKVNNAIVAFPYLLWRPRPARLTRSASAGASAAVARRYGGARGIIGGPGGWLQAGCGFWRERRRMLPAMAMLRRFQPIPLRNAMW